ncbi:ribosomal protein S18-alanine N-acetyltransferase [Streptococcus catagoni]|uniref:ribosomal protein S18-alanine N-acetyltransferase n=1 Tax=Streptococcus catagoni TaxID=2654874 RepID=UPI001408C23F|nr:ribosomal protein S18-alanine N-acetyltransferase [Streptococcus catagoni]
MKTVEEKVETLFSILTDANGKSPWTREQLKKDLLSEQVDFYFAYDKERLVGFLALQNLLGEREITNLAVCKAFQGKGIASSLLQMIDDDLPLFLEVRESNTAARALYQKFAFKVIGKRKNYYRDPIEDALIMKREEKHDR